MNKEVVEEAFSWGLVDLEPMYVIALKMCYGIRPYHRTHTMEELARMWDVTTDRIEQILFKARATIFVALESMRMV